MHCVNTCPTESYDFLPIDYPRAAGQNRPSTAPAWASPDPQVRVTGGDSNMEGVSMAVDEVDAVGADRDDVSQLSDCTSNLAIN